MDEVGVCQLPPKAALDAPNAQAAPAAFENEALRIDVAQRHSRCLPDFVRDDELLIIARDLIGLCFGAAIDAGGANPGVHRASRRPWLYHPQDVVAEM